MQPQVHAGMVPGPESLGVLAQSQACGRGIVRADVGENVGGSALRRSGPDRKWPFCRPFLEADARIRTGDPFITSEVLYQLSYVGEAEQR